MVVIKGNDTERYIEENEITHYIDEHIDYYIGDNFGYTDCYIFTYSTLYSGSKVLSGLDGIKRKIGIGILTAIKNKAIDTISINGIPYYVVPTDEVIQVYETYVYDEKENSE